jgi:ketosteroid isomerase-like protein
MNKSSWSGFVLAVLVAISPGATIAASPADEIEQAEQTRAQALINADIQALDAIYADEFFYNRAGGDSVTKAEYLPSFASGEVRVHKVNYEGRKIRVYGDTALVTGTQHNEVTIKGENRTLHLRYLNVWVKKGGGWKLVARQATNLPAQN